MSILALGHYCLDCKALSFEFEVRHSRMCVAYLIAASFAPRSSIVPFPSIQMLPLEVLDIARPNLMPLTSLLPRSLETVRLTIKLYDPTNPVECQCLYGVINNPTAYASIGDFGIRDIDNMNEFFWNANVRASAFRNTRDGIFHSDVMVDCLAMYLYTLKQTSLLRNINQSVSAPIGGISFCQRGEDTLVDVGWCSLEECMGYGYASEAAQACLEAFRNATECERDIAWSVRENKASAGVARNIGMVEAKTLENQDGRTQVVFACPGMNFTDTWLPDSSRSK